MKKAVLILIVFTILARVIGFGRDVILSYYYGASATSDAYLISLTIPTSIFALAGMAIAMNYIPLYTQMEQKEGEARARLFSSRLCGFLLVLSGLVAAAVFVFAGPVVGLFASGFTGETLEKAVLFTRIGITGILFLGVSYVYIAQLQIKNLFFITAISECILNAALVFFIALGAHGNVWLLSLGITAGPALQLLLLARYSAKKNMLIAPSFKIKDKDVNRLILLTLPVLVGISVDQVNAVADRAFASGIAVGGVSAISYAFKVSGFIHGIFAFSIGTAAYPALARMASQDNIQGLKNVLLKSVNSINIIVIPAAFGVMLFARPVVSLLFGRGSFDSAGLAMTSDALFYYSIGLAAMGMSDILARVFYAGKDTRTPLLVSVLSIALNIALNAWLSRGMGIGGLALATSIALVIRTALLFALFRKKAGAFGMRGMAATFCKIIAASAVMGICARILYGYLIAGRLDVNLSLVACASVGAGIYLLLIYRMKITNAREILGTIRKKLLKTT